MEPPAVDTISLTKRPSDSRVSERVALAIVEMIVEDDLEVGASLPNEATMLGLMGVSRASLREALRILEANGIIAVRPGPGGGPVVKQAGSRQFARMATLHFHFARASTLELFEARIVIEPMMARLAADYATPGSLDVMTQSNEHAREIGDSDPVTFGRVLTDFHDAVLFASGNRILQLVGGALKDILIDRVNQSLRAPNPEPMAALVAHDAILDAVRRGDGAEAETLMRSHLMHLLDSYRSDPEFLEEIVTWVPRVRDSL